MPDSLSKYVQAWNGELQEAWKRAFASSREPAAA